MSEVENLPNVEPKSVVALAENALSASREAALLAEQSKLFGTNFDDSFNSRYISFQWLPYNIPSVYSSVFSLWVKDLT